MTRLALALGLLALAGCGAPGADYPALVPMETLLSDAPLTPDPAPALEARADALRARAAAIRAEQP
ncbi:hypothetical protein DFO80_1038 [Rhodobacter sp. 140A]|uniref:Uncharacterized protein n=2 Tax=root TaxID=1 RepID=A0A443LNF6_9RHOB|nr:hypothetical protein [Sinirhodobacter huangdaonensis]RBP94765.1 hypothetical protein DFO80_1038 [Rhodobacter sp. 140A]RWR50684.1 hypothetical protein EOW66_13700 [Sinirhodobacter huangdaonensis]